MWFTADWQRRPARQDFSSCRARKTGYLLRFGEKKSKLRKKTLAASSSEAAFSFSSSIRENLKKLFTTLNNLINQAIRFRFFGGEPEIAVGVALNFCERLAGML